MFQLHAYHDNQPIFIQYCNTTNKYFDSIGIDHMWYCIGIGNMYRDTY